MSKFELIHTLKLLADHVGISRGLAEQVYWDLDLDKHVRAVGSTNAYDAFNRPAGREGDAARKTDKFRALIAGLLSHCDSPAEKDDIRNLVETWKLKSPMHWNKLIEVLTLIVQDEDLKDAMAKHFESRTDVRVRVGPTSVPKAVNAKETRLKLLQAASEDSFRSPASRLGDSVSLGELSVLSKTSDSQHEVFVNETMNVVERVYHSAKLGTIGQVPFCDQEDMVVGDIIWYLLGKTGTYVEVRASVGTDMNFGVDPSMDVLLQNRVKDFYPLIKSLYIVEYYIAQCWAHPERRGRVGQSLASSMRTFIYEFRLFVARLDETRRTEGLNLSSLWASIQDAKISFDLLSRIAKSVLSVDLRGGQILSYVKQSDLCFSTGDRAHRLLVGVQRAVYTPFLTMLETWIYRGVIDDPYEEFMIVADAKLDRSNPNDFKCRRMPSGMLIENPDLGTPGHFRPEDLQLNGGAYFSEDYWAKTYFLRRELVPEFLQGGAAEQILNTGKYLNVIKKCGLIYKCPFEAPIPFSENEGDMLMAAGKAHTYASHRLLKFLIDQHDLLTILGVVKHYFLLDQADFLEEFMILCDVELGGCIGDANINRLNTLLELALRISLGANEEHKDYVRGSLKQYGLEAEMRRIMSISTQDERECTEVLSGMSVPVWEAFTLSYEVKWPVSIVLQYRAMTCYQMLFRHFFHFKRVARVLCRLRCSPRRKPSWSPGEMALARNVHALKLKMVHFVQTLQHGMVFDVVEPAWHRFMAKVEEASSMDQVLMLHTEFTDTVLRDCMLVTPRLLQILRRVLDVCLHFCTYMEERELKPHIIVVLEEIAQRDGFLERHYPKYPMTEASKGKCVTFDDSLEQTVKRIDLKFCGFVFELMKVVFDDSTEFSPKLKNIIRRLNYNSFYEDQL